MTQPIWQILAQVMPPPWLREQVGTYAAQLLWQRGYTEPSQIQAFLDPQAYTPTPASAFGQEMQLAVERLRRARQRNEKVAIWGDFDADGITATAVLWEGLGQFFCQTEQLVYFIPQRPHHGLAKQGIDNLRDCQLIVTCDTGSTSLEEISYLRSLGIDLIITDHHTLPPERPDVVAIINPRYLDRHHPLYHLSGVAVAYKLVEAFYADLGEPPTDLLDLVAIGLVADLVELKADCRYLAQVGIAQIKQKKRPSIKFLLEDCKRAGDRPTDISYGIAPRINAISRIWGNVHQCVEMLTTTDSDRCQSLVKLTAEANTQRKALQKQISSQVETRITTIDLSTSPVLVLSDTAWDVGILGIVAGQIAQTHNRPVILLNITNDLARGSARSPQGIDLYELIKGQQQLLTSFGGHPLAAGLSLPVANLDLFRESIIQKYWRQYHAITPKPLPIDLVVTIAELGQKMFHELRQLEPYGMGNPSPKLLIKNCQFTEKFNAKIKNSKGQKLPYLKSEFMLVDQTGKIAGHWWDQSKDQISDLPCDVVCELVENSYKSRYEVNIINVSPQIAPVAHPPKFVIPDTTDFKFDLTGAELWQQLVGIAKYLSRTRQSVSITKLLANLSINAKILDLGIKALQSYGWVIQTTGDRLEIFTAQAIHDYPTLTTPASYLIDYVNELIFQNHWLNNQSGLGAESGELQ